MNDAQDVSFDLSGGVGHSLKYFNIDGTEAVHVDVWVEALADKMVWQDFLRNTQDFKFNLRGPDEVTAADGKRSTGCDRLFALENQGVIKVGKDCIFCLDSDDSFIKSFVPGYTSKKLPRDHVYVTNIYAVDNAFLYLEHVDLSLRGNICQGDHNVKVMPSQFILDVSSIIYEAYVALNYIEGLGRAREFSVKRKIVHESLDKLVSIAFDDYKNCSVFKDFESEISSIFVTANSAIDAIGREGFESYKQTLANIGITETNVYLFVRGHNIFDVVAALFDNVSDEYKQLEIDRLESAYADSSDQVAHVEYIWQKFSVFVKTKFMMGRVSVPYLQQTLDRLSADYSF
ncbi:hypothetical protein [Pseudomonas fluorescens]|uniref:DUF4435 domain-containing protein n=1 Tax=Pseudomonas fluorescens TaxID=294 RepID=A0A0F4TCC7_PSEFL|nr:hypothetical protein [Pseudomonas fluorescens]KJZ41764.1 hypothetical protein VC34_18510 [Pseudomonas fluorescens]